MALGGSDVCSARTLLSFYRVLFTSAGALLLFDSLDSLTYRSLISAGWGKTECLGVGPLKGFHICIDPIMESGTPSRLSFQNLLRSFKKSLEQNTRNQTQADDSLHIPNNMPIEAMKAKSPMGALHSVAEPLDNNSALKIQILSDLHLEVRRYTEDTLYHYNFPATAPHLALLGDIGCTQDPRLFDWLDLQLTRFKLIFYIAGNHEPYDSSLVCVC